MHDEQRRIEKLGINLNDDFFIKDAEKEKLILLQQEKKKAEKAKKKPAAKKKVVTPQTSAKTISKQDQEALPTLQTKPVPAKAPSAITKSKPDSESEISLDLAK